MSARNKLTPAQVLASMSIGNPTPANTASEKGDGNAQSGSSAFSLSAGESLIRLHIDSVVPYNRNPRTKINERYVEIKASIRARGIDNIVKVTKRPGEKVYFPAAGGNTRILSLKELYAEPGGERFEYVDFIYTEYTNEADILARHIVENDTRADLVFWDKVKAVQELTKEIENEIGRDNISGRQLAELLSERGVQISRELLRTYSFASERLAALGGEALYRLSGKNVREIIQPQYQKLSRLAEKFGHTTESFYEAVARPVFEATGEKFAETQEFDSDTLCSDLVDATATTLDHSSADVRRMLGVMEQTPQATQDDLTVPQATSQETPSASESAGSAKPGDEATYGGDIQAASNATGRPTSQSVTLGAGKSTDVLFANNLTPGDHTRQPQANSTGSLDLEGNSGPPSNQPLQTDATTATSASIQKATTDLEVTSKARFLTHLRAFSEEVNLESSVRFDTAFPLWFYVELPVPETEGVPLDIESQAGGNPYRYVAWWYLVSLSGVLVDGSDARNRLPEDSRIATALADDELWDDEIRNTIGEPLYEGTLGHLVTWLADPSNQAGAFLLDLLGALREVRSVIMGESS